MSSLDHILSGLRAAAEPTRLRVLALLETGQLSVKDLTAILGQSQPRISRHLKMLAEAGLVDRFPEGAWVYYQIARSGDARQLLAPLLALLDGDDPVIRRDRERRASVLSANAEAANAYFAAHADDWNALTALGLPEGEVEAALLAALGEESPVQGALLDLGTGTGRVLELLSSRFQRCIGLDASHDMLKVARANLERAGVRNAQVRQGDLFALPFDRASFDCVTLHQVLHFLDDPLSALKEAARVLKPGGVLIVADLAPHRQESLRDDHAHRRLGFSGEQMAIWFELNDLVPAGDHEIPAGALTAKVWKARARQEGSGV